MKIYISKFFTALIIGLMFTQLNYSQKNRIIIKSEKVQYKNIDSTQLHLFVYKPLNFKKRKKYNCIIFFHGGGWSRGNHKMFKKQSMYFASRGILAISVEYRIKNKHNSTPFDALEDAKSTIRFVRKNAVKFSIDPNMIAVGGGSAGGHLAASTATIKNFDNPNEDLNISSKPNVLVLLNPILDTSPKGFGYDSFKSRYKEISPIDHIEKDLPPTIILVGTNDKYVPVSTVQNYKTKMENIGSRCDLFLYKDQEHAFFAKKQKYFIETTYQSDLFLKSLGYLKGNPTIKEQYKSFSK